MNPPCCEKLAYEIWIHGIVDHPDLGWSVSDGSGNHALEGIAPCPFCGSPLPARASA